tara:strand:+ start:1630 stop:1818 length:189 start_codon:yes stop_codon:yes gene_type:complete
MKLVHIDAHPDINSSLHSLSGNFHGMPIAYLSNKEKSYINKYQLDLNKDLYYLGIRDIDTYE